MHTLSGQRVTVMGLGHFGGGLGVTRWLVDQGADVLVTDGAPAEKLGEALEALRPLIDSGRVTVRLGGHNVSEFTDADLVVANPAVPTPWENRFLRAARAAGVPVTTEVRLVVERLPARSRVIGITGSAGKSTTTAMIAHALKKMGEAAVMGGNIGGSLLGELGSVGASHRVVLELSSAMLYWLSAGVGFEGSEGFSPGVAVVTNISPNHIDWHGAFGHYETSKRAITACQRAGDTLVLGTGDRATPPGSWEVASGVRRVVVGDSGAYAAEGLSARLRLPGGHNLRNAWTAAEAVAAALAPGDGAGRVRVARAALDALADFPGLAHRLQHAGTIALAGGGEGHAFNDSKSTTPESAAMALAALDEDARFGLGRVHLIAGGYDKKVEMGPMVVPALRCAGVYCIGATGQGIADAVSGGGGRGVFCGTLEEAVRVAKASMRGGDALLLSPGCASWDQFAHFEKRGELFVKLAVG